MALGRTLGTSRGRRVARDRASDDVPLSIPERAREVPGNGLRGSPARASRPGGRHLDDPVISRGAGRAIRAGPAPAQQGWSRPRFGLRGRAARAWFEREFAALDFPGRREMPSLTDASAEALLEGLVQSSRDRTILLIRRNRHGALFAEEGQFVYRKGELTDFLRHGTADRGGP